MVGVVEMGVGKIELFVWGWDGGKGERRRKRGGRCGKEVREGRKCGGGGWVLKGARRGVRWGRGLFWFGHE